MNKKALLIGGCALAVVAIVVALIFIFTGGGDAYRSIKVFEIDGSCKVDRGGDSLDAFKNMALSSGDSLTVGEGSFARLKLDDDKYVYLEANTKINLTATGTANDSKTMVYIERGSMLTEVKKKLSATSSYDIVTPNTTMSIRGTKTLTQVLEDTVTGHVQTSNAVLEGQVKIKAVKVKADGTVVSVEKDLGAGEGNAFSSNKEELVSQEEMKSIADTGASVNGIKVEIVSEEDADVVFDVATFEASFLENVKNILVADAQAETGEEGLSQEQIDAINAQLDEVLESFDVISTESQNAINAAASGEIEPEPTPEITPEPTPEATTDSLWSWENIAVTETEDTQDEGTTLVDGDTNLVVIDDTDEADDTADRDNGADEVATEDDDNDDAADEDGEEADETDEDEVSDEDDNAGEDDVDDADDADDDDKSDGEGEEENTDEEDADKEDGEDEEAEDEESEEERLAREEAERLEREAQEEAERLAAEQAQQEAQQSQSTTSSGGSTTTRQFTYNDSTTEVSLSMGSGSSASPIPVKVEFYTESGEGNNTVTHTYSVSSLPASGFTNGAALPGFDDQYSTRVVPADESVTQTNPEAWRVESYYAFTGWYTSQEDAASNDFAKRYTTYTSALDGKQLYPGIARTTTVFLHNSNRDMGYVSFSGDASANIIRWEPVAEGVIAVVKAGSTITLPVAENHLDSETVDRAYVKLKQPSASFYCYCEVSETDSEGFPDWSNGHPDFAELRLKEQTPDSATGTSHIYYTANRPELTVGSEDTFICLDMIYTAKVEIRVADFAGDNNGRVLIHKSFGSADDYQLVGDFYSAFNSSNNGLCMLQGGNADGSTNWWKVTKASDTIASGNVTLDVYTFTTYYTGTYDRDNLCLPTFMIDDIATSSGYTKDLLCSYKIKADGLVTTYKSDSSININQFTPEFNESEQFNALRDIDGRYIFTVQPVDWLYIDMDPANAPGGVESTSVFAVGENNPFVLPHDQSVDGYKYKFAINPVDLITDTGVQPAAPFNYTILGDTAWNSNDRQYLKKFIYAPDDIIFPFNKIGGLRNDNYGTDPSSVYNSSAISESMKKSYAYIGVEGYKLSGYARESEDGSIFIMNFNDGFEGGSHFGDYPCVTSSNESVMNKVDVSVMYYRDDDIDLTVIKPIFVPLTNPTVSLSYKLPTTGADSHVDYSAQASVLENYIITINNVDQYYLELEGLSLWPISVDFARIGVTDGFKSSPFSSFIKSTPVQEQGAPLKYSIQNNGETTSSYWTAAFGQNGMSLSTKLVNLDADRHGGNIPDEDKDVLTIYPYSDPYKKNNTFIRGLLNTPSQTSNEPVTLSNYEPNNYKIVIADGEDYKYSCFVHNLGGGGEIKFGRVFTAEDSFSTTSASPEGVTRTYYSPRSAAGIIDIVGSDYYGWGYYGGIISVFRDDNYNHYTFFGNREGEIAESNTEKILAMDCTVLRSSFAEASSIYGYLGSDYTGGAGILEFSPFNHITIMNCASAYIYTVEKSTDSNDSGFHTITTITCWDNGWRKITEGLDSEITSTGKIPLAIGSDINDVPEGFVYTESGYGSGAIYVGTANYTVTGQATPSSINAATFSATVDAYTIETH